ncbi:ALP1-like protein [Tanacetum coccineum]
MKHSKARNVIERCFGLLKGRWKILASPSFFPITTQVRIILACFLLHNLIRRYIRVDPQELEQDEDEIEHEEQLVEEASLSHISPTDEWYNFRDVPASTIQAVERLATAIRETICIIFLDGSLQPKRTETYTQQQSHRGKSMLKVDDKTYLKPSAGSCGGGYWARPKGKEKVLMGQSDVAGWGIFLQELREIAEDVFANIANEVLRVRVNHKYPLSQAPQAYLDLESRTTTGSIVLIPDGVES